MRRWVRTHIVLFIISLYATLFILVEILGHLTEVQGVTQMLLSGVVAFFLVLVALAVVAVGVGVAVSATVRSHESEREHESRRIAANHDREVEMGQIKHQQALEVAKLAHAHEMEKRTTGHKIELENNEQRAKHIKELRPQLGSDPSAYRDAGVLPPDPLDFEIPTDDDKKERGFDGL